MGNSIDIDEFAELLNIPQFEREMYHKIEELKVFFRDEVVLYKKIKDQFRKAVRDGVEGSGKERKRTRMQTYLFELSQDENNRWVPTEIEPPPPPGHDAYDILPEDLIKNITFYAPNPARIETLNNFSVSSLPGRAFNLKFTKFSPNHIMGTVTEVFEDGRETIPDVVMIDVTDSYKQESAEVNYKQLTRYMDQFPQLREFVLSEFFMRWKPLIDQNLI